MESYYTYCTVNGFFHLVTDIIIIVPNALILTAQVNVRHYFTSVSCEQQGLRTTLNRDFCLFWVLSIQSAPRYLLLIKRQQNNKLNIFQPARFPIFLTVPHMAEGKRGGGEVESQNRKQIKRPVSRGFSAPNNQFLGVP